MRGMGSLQQAGVISEVGISNYSLARWRAAEKALGSRVLSNQVEYSLVHRSPDVSSCLSQSRTTGSSSPSARWPWDCFRGSITAPPRPLTRSGPSTRSSVPAF